MNIFLILKFFHILTVAVTIGGMFARQLVRTLAKRENEITAVALLTRAAMRIDRVLVIPWSNLIFIFGIMLALLQKWPVLGFLQGAAQNWLLVSNLLLVALLATIFTVFVPYNRKMEPVLQDAVAERRITPPLSAMLDDQKNRWAHHAEETIIVLITALMVLKPF